ncbi:hypothetical protein WJ970_10730 [Achromobacter xylosoxidans]
MSQLTVQILSGMCCGFGNCAALCPQVFALDYDSNRTRIVPGAPLEDYAARSRRPPASVRHRPST